MTEVQQALYNASVSRMRSQITGKAAAAAADRSNKGVEKFLRTLGAKKISHMFTHLRKIAQHPLLVRSHYGEDVVARIAKMAHDRCVCAGAGGGGGGGTGVLGCWGCAVVGGCRGAGGGAAGCVHSLETPLLPHSHTPLSLPCPALPRPAPPPTGRQLFGAAATERRVRDELLGYSDFSLHAFCYGAGPEFTQFRLDQEAMMASTKFVFLKKLLLQVPGRGAAAGCVCGGGRGSGTERGAARPGGLPGIARCSHRLPLLALPRPCPRPRCAAQVCRLPPAHLQPVDCGAGHHGVADGGAAAEIRAA